MSRPKIPLPNAGASNFTTVKPDNLEPEELLKKEKVPYAPSPIITKSTKSVPIAQPPMSPPPPGVSSINRSRLQTPQKTSESISPTTNKSISSASDLQSHNISTQTTSQTSSPIPPEITIKTEAEEKIKESTSIEIGIQTEAVQIDSENGEKKEENEEKKEEEVFPNNEKECQTEEDTTVEEENKEEESSKNEEEPHHEEENEEVKEEVPVIEDENNEEKVEEVVEEEKEEIENQTEEVVEEEQEQQNNDIACQTEEFPLNEDNNKQKEGEEINDDFENEEEINETKSETKEKQSSNIQQPQHPYTAPVVNTATNKEISFDDEKIFITEQSNETSNDSYDEKVVNEVISQVEDEIRKEIEDRIDDESDDESDLENDNKEEKKQEEEVVGEDSNNGIKNKYLQKLSKMKETEKESPNKRRRIKSNKPPVSPITSDKTTTKEEKYISNRRPQESPKQLVKRLQREKREREERLKKIHDKETEALIEWSNKAHQELEAREKLVKSEREKQLIEKQQKIIEKKIKEAETIAELRLKAREVIANQDNYLYKKKEKEFREKEQKEFEEKIRQAEEQRHQEIYTIPLDTLLEEHEKILKENEEKIKTKERPKRPINYDPVNAYRGKLYKRVLKEEQKKQEELKKEMERIQMNKELVEKKKREDEERRKQFKPKVSPRLQNELQYNIATLEHHSILKDVDPEMIENKIEERPWRNKPLLDFNPLPPAPPKGETEIERKERLERQYLEEKKRANMYIRSGFIKAEDFDDSNNNNIYSSHKSSKVSFLKEKQQRHLRKEIFNDQFDEEEEYNIGEDTPEVDLPESNYDDDEEESPKGRHHHHHHHHHHKHKDNDKQNEREVDSDEKLSEEVVKKYNRKIQKSPITKQQPKEIRGDEEFGEDEFDEE